MVRSFDKFKDFPIVRDWFRERGDEIKITRLPKTGFIKENVCACFLFHDESSSVAFIHGLISNPKASGKEVLSAIDEMFEAGKDYCTSHSIDVLLLFTGLHSLKSIAEARGFIHTENVSGMVKNV